MVWILALGSAAVAAAAASVAPGRDGQTPPFVLEKTRVLRALLLTSPQIEADRALARGDTRLWRIPGIGIAPEGIELRPGDLQRHNRCGYRWMPGVSDVLYAETRDLYRPAERWAIAYNRWMVARSGCLDRTPPAQP